MTNSNTISKGFRAVPQLKIDPTMELRPVSMATSILPSEFRGTLLSPRSALQTSKTDRPASELTHSDNRWERTEAAGMDKLVRPLNSILNKLSINLFETLSKQFVDLVREQCDSLDVLEDIVKLVYEKAVRDSNFGDMFPRFCQVLSQQLPSFQKKSTNESISFQTTLVKLVEQEFETSLRIARSLDASPLQEEEGSAFEEHMKQKLTMLGHMKFMGELYNRDMISSAIISESVSVFLSNSHDPSESNIECLCALLSVSGRKLETDPELKGCMKQWIAQLEKISASPQVSIRIRFNIIEVIELRRNKWTPRREQDKAGRIHESGDISALSALAMSEMFVQGCASPRYSRPSSGTTRGRRSGDRYNISNLSKVKMPIKPPAERKTVKDVSDSVEVQFAYDYLLPEDVEKRINGFIREYVSARDINEVTLCMDEIVSVDAWTRNNYIVANSFFCGLEMREHDRPFTMELLAKLLSKQLISQSNFIHGLSVALYNLVEGMSIMADLPIAPSRINEMLHVLVSTDQVSVSDIADACLMTEEKTSQHTAFDTIMSGF